MQDRLFRSRDDRMLAGVAGGLAELWDADPSLVRIVWALLTVFTGGIALVVYIVMAIVVPEGEPAPWPGSASPAATPTGETGPDGAPAGGSLGTPTTSGWTQPTARESRQAARAARRAERRAGGDSGVPLILGGFLVILGAFFLVREWLPQIDFDWFWPAMLIVLGVVILVAAFGRGRDTTGPSSGAS
jgi:phage shock protein C